MLVQAARLVQSCRLNQTFRLIIRFEVVFRNVNIPTISVQSRTIEPAGVVGAENLQPPTFCMVY